ncbi:hypothetical protein BGZ96_003280 [Linnemannia gamsii]|uniref:RNI-like protein n=1 Tax=Linnemannia gamsii TaxID=64522 RepID=A0ABQ7JJK4_9FUNG|nr:hypothetical protein BGZ96_003280 [Linnemannia gamsii]
MTNLTELFINVEPKQSDRCYPFFDMTHRNCMAIFSQVCWMIQLSPQLDKLTVKSLPTRGALEVSFLVGIIAGMSTLKALDVGIFLSTISDSTEWFRIWADFTQRAPSSLQKLAFYLDYMGSLAGDEADGIFGGTEVMAESPQRQDVLPALTELGLLVPSFHDSTIPVNDIRKVLERCPNLDKISVHHLNVWTDESALADVLPDCCPQLRRITHDAYLSERSARSLNALMMTLPQGQLKELEYKSYSGDLNIIGSTKLAILRHSSSLQRIVFESCGVSQSRSIGLVLSECIGLEELELCPNNGFWASCTYLEDAVAAMPWACTNIRHLSIAIARTALPGDPVYKTSGQEPFYNRSEPTALSEEESAQFTLLERLFQQIGSLAELRRLNLRSFITIGVRRMVEGQDYLKNTFPGMMSLGDVETGRRGFLDLLGGLRKLQEICGSVYASTPEGRATVGWAEARWMHDNWSDLRVAEYYFKDEEPEEHFQWLRDQRQRWKLELFGLPPS